MSDFLQSILSGLTTACVWAVLLWLVNVGRNHFIERKLRESLKRFGTSYGGSGFGLTLKNETRIPIVVRDVILLTESLEVGIDLPYISGTREFLVTEKKTKSPVQFQLRSRGHEMRRELTPHAFVELPPYTGGLWGLDPQFFMENQDVPPTGARATVEYRSFLGSPKLIIIYSDQGSSGHIKETYKRFVEYMQKMVEQESGAVSAPRSSTD